MSLEFDIITFIQSVGFPISVAVWLIWRSSKQDSIIIKNTEALQGVKDVIQNCNRRGR